MHKFKYFRIIKRIDVCGRTEFVLQAANTWFDKLFGLWEVYSLKHDSIEKAMNHLSDVLDCRIKTETTEFVTRQVLIKKSKQ